MGLKKLMKGKTRFSKRWRIKKSKSKEKSEQRHQKKSKLMRTICYCRNKFQKIFKRRRRTQHIEGKNLNLYYIVVIVIIMLPCCKVFMHNKLSGRMSFCE